MTRASAFVAFLSVCSLLFAPVRAGAEPLDARRIPEPLKPWTSWVLDGKDEALCPTFQASGDLSRCAWPTALSLTLDDKGGRFEQKWHLDARLWVPLPGDATRWPEEVNAGGKKLVVVWHNDAPSVALEPGDVTITGKFAWDSLPDSLPVPAETGIVSLTLSGATVREPSRDGAGRIFLQKTAPADESERLEVLVHRKVTDDVPLLLTTRIVMNVSGKSREVVLGKSLPSGFVPMSIVTDLPARIEGDTRLRVQVRPGTYTIEMTARSEDLVRELQRPNPDGPWRDGEEVWVFEAKSTLRLTSVEGARAIDPQQTSLPDAWKALPAYSMALGDKMQLVEKRRGDVDPEPDQLTLARTLWLDFDGRGYSVSDTVTGTVHAATRLEMNPPTVLGRVSVDGKDQFITHTEGGTKAGVEIRQGNLQISADSRIPGDLRDIPATGYDHDFHEVSTTLNLPPGYRVFHVSGADEVPGTWIRQWTLLEIFLVLVLSLAFGKLFGRGWGVVAGVTFALVFPETDSPEWIWPAVLVAEALVRVIPAGRVRSVFAWLRIAVLATAALVTLPFVVQHVREGIYPALAQERSFDLSGLLAEKAAPEPLSAVANAPVAGAAAPAAPPVEPQAPAEDALKKQELPLGSSVDEWGSRAKSGSGGPGNRRYQQFNTEEYDPNAVVQTGPGLPKWQWTATSVRFSGPVDRTQRLHLYLVPPSANLLLALVRAALLVIVFVRLLPRLSLKLPGSPAAASSVAALVVLLLGAPSARADVPPQDMLDHLRDRLLAKPDCTPNCASATRMWLETSGDVLRARLELQASATTAVPLPGGTSQWLPERVLVDGAVASGLDRTADGQLWLRVDPGTHDVVVEGALPNRESFQLALPLKPHRVEAHVEGWLLEGLHEDGLADDHLQLTRVHKQDAESGGALAAGTLPPFVRVERTLLVGLNWQMATRVVRVTPPGTAVVLEVPLLKGESVTTAEVRVVAGKALVNMAPDATEVAWNSVLEEKSPVVLAAPKTAAWTELWRLDSSPIWHATLSGIPVVHGEAGARIPEWRPWPGETVTVELTRPEGVPGQTLTIDGCDYDVTPGLRATDATISFNLRSSRGTEHVVRIPDGAELESVTINGASQPLRRQGRNVTLSIVPGAQSVVLGFRIPGGVKTFFTVPPFDFGTPAVNISTRVHISDARWVLFLRGPRLGPAILFWSLLLVLGVVAYGLGAVSWVPLSRAQWLLLAIGLSQVPLPAAAIVIGWLLLLGFRKEQPDGTPLYFDLRQLAIIGATLAALGILVYAVQQGLMGTPDMQVRGNGSYAGFYQWYDDRTGPVPTSPMVVSVSIFAYRAAMLAWALWLARSVLVWLRFGWESFATGGLWKKRVRNFALPSVAVPTPAAPVETPAAESTPTDDA